MKQLYWRMRKSFFCIFLLCFSGLVVAQASDQSLAINTNTPIVFSDTKRIQVLEDVNENLAVQDVLQRQHEFKPVADMPEIVYYRHYWIAQRIFNSLSTDYVLRIDPTGWESIQPYSINANGEPVALKISGNAWVSHNHLADTNPFLPNSANAPSQFSLVTIPSGTEVMLLTRVVSSGLSPAKSFSLKLINHTKFLELKRFGIYVEGLLLGILLALAIFGAFLAYSNKDKTSLAYSVWIFVAMINTASNYMPEGPRMAEFFVDMEGIRFLHHYLYRPTFVASGYGQALFYAVFAATFLNVKKHAPWLYKLTIAYIVYVIAHYFVTNFMRHQIPQLYLWLPNGIFTFVILFSFFGVAFVRYREGQNDSGFLLIAIIPYLVFRTIYVLGLAGIPSPFTLMEPQGIGLLMHDSNVAQAIGICSEAVIMALAVIGRTRWLQTQLARNMQAQKVLVENQNRLLEETVQTRTKELQLRTDELAQQHEALDKAHRLVISSVDYASRVQRGQLPKLHRSKGRFVSLDVLWLPRDVIGGDLWWLGGTSDDHIFNLAVADCTGHGVPGAMLSSLVSHSLDRIYSDQPALSPSQALMHLDQMVRVALNQDSEFSESDDGCDAMVVRIDRADQHIVYAGAKIDLLQVSSQRGVIRHPSARTSLGYRDAPRQANQPQDHRISYQSGDVFVVVTDGFTDQVGGQGARLSSFGYKRLQVTLQNCVGMDAPGITQLLHQTLMQWRAAQTQRDDITVVVFQL